MSSTTPKAFTGYHMTAILVGFFGIVIAVNIFMARMAIGSFGGTVVDNSYVASQNYNTWLAEAERQQQLGWAATITRAERGRLRVAVTEKGVAGAGFIVSGVAQHPLGRAPQRVLTFTAQGQGEWLSNELVPAGRWQVHVGLKRGQDHYRTAAEIR